jgi:hypothetical protein
MNLVSRLLIAAPTLTALAFLAAPAAAADIADYEAYLAGERWTTAAGFARFSVGVVPQIDTVDTKTELNGQTLPEGRGQTETTPTAKSTALATRLEYAWGRSDLTADWVWSLGLDYNYRSYAYDFPASPDFPAGTTEQQGMWALGLIGGVAWGAPLNDSKLSYEIGPFLSGGMLWADHDSLNMTTFEWGTGTGRGWYMAGGLRAGLYQTIGSWQLGLTGEWQTGIGYSGRGQYGERDNGDGTTTAFGSTKNEMHLFWRGFGAGLVLGTAF